MIYLDTHATTPLDPIVARHLLPWLQAGTVANAGSPNIFGQAAAEAIDEARRTIASLVGGVASRVIFTSGATESNNLSLASLVGQNRAHVISSPLEHPSVLETLLAARDAGQIALDLVDVGLDGAVSVADIAGLIRPSTALLSFQGANNETGVLNPIGAIGRLAADHGALFHCDGAQLVGKVPLSLVETKIDLLSISGHKMYGPMGVGAVAASAKGFTALAPQLRGGGQEFGLRSGTVNVPGVVGLGWAGRVAADRLSDDGGRIALQRDSLQQALMTDGDAAVNGLGERLPGSLSIRFAGIPADALIARCSDVAISSGSACSSGSPAPSKVLLAMGLTEEQAEESIRIGISRDLSDKDVSRAASIILGAVQQLRPLVHA